MKTEIKEYEECRNELSKLKKAESKIKMDIRNMEGCADEHIKEYIQSLYGFRVGEIIEYKGEDCTLSMLEVVDLEGRPGYGKNCFVVSFFLVKGEEKEETMVNSILTHDPMMVMWPDGGDRIENI